MKLYNTLSRQKEEFKPIQEGVASIYSCGPTVYQYAHIGNMRSYVFMDILRRALKYNGYNLKHVMNITDVGHLVSDADEGEDKMVKTAKQTQKSPLEIAEYYTGVFMKDIAELNIEKPEYIPKATEHIDEMLQFVEELAEKGFAYETSDGIYFDIMKFEGYGKLSRLDLEGQIAGARVDVNEEKRHPADFALWKKAPKEHIMQWPSPWGMGYPGWHIECSAMSRKYLGDVFDIHTGGVDHIPVHHENEIAQSEALLGKPAVHYWLHGEFLLIDNGKMSKSLGNAYTIADIKKEGYSPLAFRYMCLNANYRSKLNFTWEGIKAAQVALDRLFEGVLAHRKAPEGIELEAGLLKRFEEDFKDAVNDDLNIPKALGVAWNAVKHGTKSQDIYGLLLKMDNVLGLDFANIAQKHEDEASELSPEIEELVNIRQQARKDKNWKLADEIRDKLNGMGIQLEDTPEGVKATRK
ncbi:MAG: cysteine--tRNA ligase [Clostridiaceae bacterium]|jgi:cysteinyl-tRNA synthetase|nr:cysteine--tRNA ligase [Clostridiaceae bacterium]